MKKMREKFSRMLFGSIVVLPSLVGIWLVCSAPVRAQWAGRSLGITADQLRALLPDVQDLQGFIRIQPASDAAEAINDRIRRGDANRPAPDTSDQIQARPIADRIALDKQLHPNQANSGAASVISRDFYSLDGRYSLNLTIWLCASVDTARTEITAYRGNVQEMFRQGTSSSSLPLGDESWVNSGTLLFRFGTAVALIHSGTTWDAAHKGVEPRSLPESVDAVGNMILFRMAAQSRLIGVPSAIAQVSVNGKAVSKQAVMVKGQPYVPVLKFADALGWKSQWDVKTGALSLQGPARKQIRLAAGSTAATSSDGKPASLKVPVLKDANVPVMRLGDLVSVFHGRLATQGNDFRVSI